MSRSEAKVGIPEAVEWFLRGLRTGDWEGIEGYLASDVLYDASVPGWHYQYEGAIRVAQEYRQEWTGRHIWEAVEQNVSPTPDGVVVDFELRGRCPGDDDHPAHEEAVRMANLFRIVDGRIVEHRFYCCGEWDEETLRRIEAEAPKVRRGAEMIPTRRGR